MPRALVVVLGRARQPSYYHHFVTTAGREKAALGNHSPIFFEMKKGRKWMDLSPLPLAECVNSGTPNKNKGLWAGAFSSHLYAVARLPSEIKCFVCAEQ